MDEKQERQLQIARLHNKIKNYTLTPEEKQISFRRQLELVSSIEYKFAMSTANRKYQFPLSHTFNDDEQNYLQKDICNLHSQNENREKRIYEKIKNILYNPETLKTEPTETNQFKFKKTEFKIFYEKSAEKDDKQSKKQKTKRLLTDISNEKDSSLENTKTSFKKYATRHIEQVNKSKQNLKETNSYKRINNKTLTSPPPHKIGKQSLITLLLNRLQESKSKDSKKIERSSNEKFVKPRVYPETTKANKVKNFSQSYKFEGLKKYAEDIKINEPYLCRVPSQEKIKADQKTRRLMETTNIKKTASKQLQVDIKKIFKKEPETYQTLKPNNYTSNNRVGAKQNVAFKSLLNVQSPMNKGFKANKATTFTNR